VSVSPLMSIRPSVPPKVPRAERMPAMPLKTPRSARSKMKRP
jgi:hypothetical protein